MIRKIPVRFFGTVFLCFFFFTWVAPSLRISIFGAEPSSGFAETFVSLLPDFFLFAVILLAVLLWWKSRDEKLQLTFLDKTFIFFWCTNVVLGFLLAMSPKLSILAFRITYLPMLFYPVGRILAVNKDNGKRLMNGILLITALFCVVGIIVYFFFPSLTGKIALMEGHEENKYFISRMTSILWTPVLFGTLVMIALVYCTYRIMAEKWKPGYFFFALLWFCLFMSVSRGPIIAYLIALITLAFIFRSWKQLVFLFAIQLVISCTISLFVTHDLHMLLWIFSSTGDTLALENGVTRVNRWAETWKDFLARPYGYGLGKAGAVAFRFLINSNIPSAPYSTDGWLLKLGCETGIFGILSYLFMCLIYFVRSLKRMVANKNKLLPVAFAVFLATNAQAIISNVYDFYPYFAIYWLLLGLGEKEESGGSITR